MPPTNLRTAPRFYRSPIARGLKANLSSAGPAVDPTGGDEGAGVIRGMAVITRGEALGHGLWIDALMLQQTAAGINSSSNGAKARFTHPSLSGDGLGKFTGRVKSATVEGDVVRGDLHFTPSAHETPDGDLAGYLMQLAKSDLDAEEAFMIENGAVWKSNGWGYDALSGFISPDPDNAGNLPHSRLKELRAVDAVDEPAANPSGLFHRGQAHAADAEAMLSYALGLSTDRPALTALDVDPDRAAAFVRRYLERNGLTIARKPDDAPARTAVDELTRLKRERFERIMSPGMARFAAGIVLPGRIERVGMPTP